MLSNNEKLRESFSALPTYQLIRIQAHTEAWGVVSPYVGWINDNGTKG